MAEVRRQTDPGPWEPEVLEILLNPAEAALLGVEEGAYLMVRIVAGWRREASRNENAVKIARGVSHG